MRGAFSAYVCIGRGRQALDSASLASELSATMLTNTNEFVNFFQKIFFDENACAFLSYNLKSRKECGICRYRRAFLSNEDLVAKIGFVTAENGLFKV